MSRLLVFLYGVVAYAIGMGGLVWFILFIGGWDFLPSHIDSGEPGPIGVSLLVNLGLIVLFGAHHTVTARPAFKEAVAGVVPRSVERSTYVLVSGVTMGLICLFWRPLGGALWNIDNSVARVALTSIQIAGWTLAVAATFLINHFELFGLQRVYCHLVDKPEPASQFTERSLYKLVRHPLQLGLLIGIWSTPTMTMTHLMLSVTMTIYIFIGLHYEERDLVAVLGQDYRDYQTRVRMLLPIPKRPPAAP